MKIIDIHSHVYKKVAGITNSSPMTSEQFGKVKIGNRLVQFLPPSFENTDSKVETLITYMDWVKISKALLMPNPYYGYNNEYFIECINRYSGRLKGVALVNLLEGKKAAEELANIYDNTPLFGLKVETNSTFQCAPYKRMTDEDLLSVWDCCNQYKQPVFLHLFSDKDIEDLKILIQNFNDITFVICHMGADSCFLPEAGKQNFNEILQIVKKNKKVYIDTSTVPVYYSEEYPFPSAVKAIEKGYQIVGPEKMMWASDYPGMLCHATMAELINMILNHCNIPEKDLELIMGENADRLFF